MFSSPRRWQFEGFFQLACKIRVGQRWLNKIFEQQLKNDGVLTKKDKKFNLQLTESSLIVNGKLLSETLTEKYKGIYLGLMRKENCVGCTISFEIDKDYSFNENGY